MYLKFTLNDKYALLLQQLTPFCSHAILLALLMFMSCFQIVKLTLFSVCLSTQDKGFFFLVSDTITYEVIVVL